MLTCKNARQPKRHDFLVTSKFKFKQAQGSTTKFENDHFSILISPNAKFAIHHNLAVHHAPITN